MSTQCPTPILEPLDLAGQRDPAISYTIASIALEIIGSHKLHHHNKAKTLLEEFYILLIKL
jgi:hypothetical protein